MPHVDVGGINGRHLGIESIGRLSVAALGLNGRLVGCEHQMVADLASALLDTSQGVVEMLGFQ